MSRWFRVYDDLVDDPKIQRLPGETVKSLLNLWCLASQNGGLLPAADDIAFKLRTTPAKVERLLSVLGECGLIDSDEDGLRPHNWSGRQFKSDTVDETAAERMRRYRALRRNNRNADCNGDGPVTVPRAETEQITETEKITRSAKAVTRDENFEAFWAAYPGRQGDNPKAPSAKLFSAAVKAGADPQEIIDAAKRFATSEHRNIGTPYIPQTVKWLRNKRWLDFGPLGAGGNSAPTFDIRSHLV